MAKRKAVAEKTGVMPFYAPKPALAALRRAALEDGVTVSRLIRVSLAQSRPDLANYFVD